VGKGLRAEGGVALGVRRARAGASHGAHTCAEGTERRAGKDLHPGVGAGSGRLVRSARGVLASGVGNERAGVGGAGVWGGGSGMCVRGSCICVGGGSGVCVGGSCGGPVLPGTELHPADKETGACAQKGAPALRGVPSPPLRGLESETGVCARRGVSALQRFAALKGFLGLRGVPALRGVIILRGVITLRGVPALVELPPLAQAPVRLASPRRISRSLRPTPLLHDRSKQRPAPPQCSAQPAKANADCEPAKKARRLRSQTGSQVRHSPEGIPERPSQGGAQGRFGGSSSSELPSSMRGAAFWSPLWPANKGRGGACQDEEKEAETGQWRNEERVRETEGGREGGRPGKIWRLVLVAARVVDTGGGHGSVARVRTCREGSGGLSKWGEGGGEETEAAR
jgi:hypothetical protein